MQTWIRSGLIRCSRNFSTGMALMLGAFLWWSSPITVDPNSTIAAADPAEKKTTIASNRQQKSPSRWIEIDLSKQRLYAWEGKNLVHSVRISGGKKSTPTVTGRFQINSKYRTHRMKGRDYDIPDVPYAMYFYGGYAIHGAYWHNRFGTPVSHGCVNLPVKQARKIYNWAQIGTLVVVHQ